MFGALALAFIAGMFLAGRMVVPIQALRAGAARIGRGDLSQRIAIKTGDEVEALADQFNDMAGRLQESYAGLEQKVEDRTRALSESLEDLRTAQDRLVQTEKLASLGGDPHLCRPLRRDLQHALCARGLLARQQPDPDLLPLRHSRPLLGILHAGNC